MQIAPAAPVDRPDLSRILRLARLAPDIVEAILGGCADQRVMLERLERPLPRGCDAHRQEAGSCRAPRAAIGICLDQLAVLSYGDRRSLRALARVRATGNTGGQRTLDGRLGPRLTTEESSMANALAEKSCTPCRGGIPPLTTEQALRYLAQAPDWALLDDGRKIQRTYRFKNFREALGFVQRRRASSPRPRAIIPTSPLAGAMPRSRCRPRRSRACTRMTSSWPPSSTACRQLSAHPRSGRARDIRLTASSRAG